MASAWCDLVGNVLKYIALNKITNSTNCTNAKGGEDVGIVFIVVCELYNSLNAEVTIIDIDGLCAGVTDYFAEGTNAWDAVVCCLSRVVLIFGVFDIIGSVEGSGAG
eukprot:1622090-Ditylum_brightwellii.AAC.1